MVGLNIFGQGTDSSTSYHHFQLLFECGNSGVLANFDFPLKGDGTNVLDEVFMCQYAGTIKNSTVGRPRNKVNLRGERVCVFIAANGASFNCVKAEVDWDV